MFSCTTCTYNMYPQEFGFDSLDRIELITESDIDDLGLNRGEKRILLNALAKLKTSSSASSISSIASNTLASSTLANPSLAYNHLRMTNYGSSDDDELTQEKLFKHNGGGGIHDQGDVTAPPPQLTSFDRINFSSSNGSSNQYSSGGSNDDRNFRVLDPISGLDEDSDSSSFSQEAKKRTSPVMSTVNEIEPLELPSNLMNSFSSSSLPAGLLATSRLDSSVSDVPLAPPLQTPSVLPTPPPITVGGAGEDGGRSSSSSQLLGQDGYGGARELSWAELTVGAIVGQGSFGMVRKGKWRGMDVAIKTIKNRVPTVSPTATAAAGRGGGGGGGGGNVEEYDDAEKDRKLAVNRAAAELRHEAAMLARVCHHESVVEFVGIVPEKLAVVMKFMKNGSLQSLIYAKNAPVTTAPTPGGVVNGSAAAAALQKPGLPSEYQSIEREIMVIRMAVEATRGLQHLHSEGVIHR
jgi:hypothetical protein